jgi:multidrug efflux pump subunit AcrA (membrane-fusion protein)
MKKILALLSIIVLVGCSQSKKDSADVAPQTAVTVTHITYGQIKNEIVLTGTTVYQDKSIISSPIQAYVSAAYVQPGTVVRRGKLLYTLESKEHRALAGSEDMAVKGFIPVRAAASGVVLSVMQQMGSYVTEGDVLCTIANIGSMMFELNVPYEQNKYVTPGRHCTIVLPDNTRLNAVIGKSLASMNTDAQVQQIIARAKSPFLPEGMTVKVIVSAGGSGANKMILPKSAVQSNETLTEYWVMRVKNNSTAEKVPVQIGNSNTSSIEIYSSSLSANDLIVLTGGYGLDDNAKVKITKRNE